MQFQDLKIGELYTAKYNSCEEYDLLHDASNRNGRPVLLRVTNITDEDEFAYLVGYWENNSFEPLRRCNDCFNACELELFVPPKAVRKPKLSIDRVIMPNAVKEEIRAAISQKTHSDKIFNEWGFGAVFEKGIGVSLLFYGPPGTGKTLMAQAVADDLNMKFKIIQSAEVQSSVPGETERKIKAFFAEAQKSNTLLLFDECDSLIAPRDEVGMILAAEINALLSSLELFEGVCVFTTNRLGRMDSAFERRLSAKIEFPMPDEYARLRIWQSLIPKKAPVKGVNFEHLAKFELSGGHIKNVVLNAARRAAYLQLDEIPEGCFTFALERELKARRSFEDAAAQDFRRGRPIGAAKVGGRKELTNVSEMSKP